MSSQFIVRPAVRHARMAPGILFPILSMRFDRIAAKNCGGRPTPAYGNRKPTIMTEQKTDWTLIRAYLDHADERSFETLLKRHYDFVYKRLLRHCKHPEDAADMAQQLWIRVVNNLGNYRDDGKFPAFLMRATSNMLTDYWRRKGVKDKVIQGLPADDETDLIDIAVSETADGERLLEAQQQVSYLTQTLIPRLVCEQRLAFLLIHESEHWEEKHRLGWCHLAELNGISEQAAWTCFEQVRNYLMIFMQGEKAAGDAPDCEAMLIFLVWTQAQRLSKKQEFTWDYFSKILGVSTNTLKTRYRTALKKLAAGLKSEQQEQ